jgi:tetratricopeptide (TPR) repeat protein
MLLAVGLLTARFAFAKDTDDKEAAARAACLSGEFAKGVSILSELFVKTKDPVQIYNQGRCFEQNQRYEDAIARFQEFLRVGRKLGKADKEDAQKQIADCQDLLAKQKAETAAGRPASASHAGTKEAKDRAAKRACLTGDPNAGVAILTDLYIDTNDPTYLFNQGRCFEQNQRYQEAIGRFREYLVKAKNHPPEEKADANKHIATCESYLRGTGAEEASPKPAAERPQPQETGAFPGVSAAPPGPGHTGAGLRTAGIVTAAVGGAGLVTGLLLNLKVNSMSSDLENGYDPSVDGSRKSYKTAGWIAYSAGAALVAGGAVLYYLGWRRGRGAPPVALIPAAGGGMAGTLVVGAF